VTYISKLLFFYFQNRRISIIITTRSEDKISVPIPRCVRTKVTFKPIVFNFYENLLLNKKKISSKNKTKDILKKREVKLF
jgi:hypothetical protein